jgi:8-oxo-dGTP diphosphatase
VTNAVVRAAGGVVIRDGEHGPEVAIVHRPRYDDWSLPKGKRDPGETDEQCAVREVEEETGLRCTLGRELLPTRYVDRKGRPKVVRYWDMEVVDSRPFVANDEIDELLWSPLDDAIERLSYPHDADVLANVRVPFTFRPPSSTLGVTRRP